MSDLTLTIVKPDSVEKGNFGKIVARVESEGFEFLAIRKLQLTTAQAQQFYAVHRERPFFNDLVAYMTSGPVFVAALRKESAVKSLRNLMGATNPQDAEEGTIRREFGESIERNAIHGSDSDENARREIGFFFSEIDLV
ncbi:MAG: nucleoside-diphosphate kinase [Thermoanaerobaculia bacterium]|nr:nucleoside-diphosphate kinase [Thermoanaerobaculia bacterium]